MTTPGDVALCVPLEVERELSADAGRRGIRIVARCSGAAELAARVPALGPSLVVTVARPQYLDAALLATCDAHGVRLVVGAGTRDEQRYASALGIAETVSDALTWDALAAPPPSVGGRESPTRRGEVVTVWGPAGAPGRSSLAIALAAELALAGGAVALGDADTHAAAIAPALGLLDEAPGFAAACRLAGAGTLSRDEFERVAEWVPLRRGGLSVLTGIGRPSRWPELTADRVAGTLAAARSWIPTLVLDTAASLEQDEELSTDLGAPRRNAATLAAVRDADRVVLVGAADAIGLARLLRARAELAELVPAERITVVVNKVRASAIGLSPDAQVRQTLARFGGIDDPVLVPWDPAAFDAALLSGRPLGEAAPRSSARAAIRALALERLSAAEPEPRRRRLLGERRLA